MELALRRATEGWDLQIVNSDIQGETTLQTAVLLSLHTDDRDPTINPRLEDPRGWMGMEFLPRVQGSQLWRLQRAPLNEQTRVQAEKYAQAALAWLVDEGFASEATVTASILEGVLIFYISIDGSLL